MNQNVTITKRDKKGYYHVDGEPHISVTTVVKKILGWNEGAIRNWWCKYGYDEAIRVRNAAGNYGTKLHIAFDKHFFKDEPVESQYYNRTQQIWKWLAANKIELVQGEIEVYNKEHKYAGQTDGLAKKDGQHILIDWKSGSQRDFEGTIQLGAYAHCDNIPDIAEAWDIYVGKNDGETVKFVRRSKEELEIGYQSILRMLGILRLQKELGKVRRKNKHE